MGSDLQPAPLTAAVYRAQEFGRMKEEVFQGHVIRLARALGWDYYHTRDSRRSQPGYPDLHLWHPVHGQLFRELKTMRGRLSPDQVKVVASLTAAGADVAVWRPADLDGLILDELRGNRNG